MGHNSNRILNADSYKIGHWRQFPADTQYVQYYFESRGGPWKPTFFGLKYLAWTYLAGSITEWEIEEAIEVCKDHFGRTDMLNVNGWDHILNDHIGMLPLKITSVEEGKVYDNKEVLFTAENTCPQCYWLPGFVETILVNVWHPCTVATISRVCRENILKYLELSGDPSLIDYKLHDFGMRGSSSPESAALGGAAHLLNFKGTDTLSGLMLANEYYPELKLKGHSIDASEHSTITIRGEADECSGIERMLDLNPTGLVACVCDSYNLERAVKEYIGIKLRDKILARNGTLVVRPDSGKPTHIVPQVLNWLWDAFGGTVNSKGFKVLDPHVRVIQGDGINVESIPEILQAVVTEDFSVDNVNFGMGGGLHTWGDRDTLKFAMKMCWADGRGVSKRPVTDLSKSSKSGYQTIPNGKVVFLNGEVL